MYFVYIYTLFLLNFDWIIWTNYRRRRHARIPSQSHAESSKNPRIYCKMSIKFIQKSTELNGNPYQNTYLHNKHSYSKCKLWKSKLSCLSPQISLTWQQLWCFFEISASLLCFRRKLVSWCFQHQVALDLCWFP